MSQPILNSIAAHLYVRDLNVTTNFFTQKLGFTIDFIYGDPAFYAQVRRDRALLILKSMDEDFFTRQSCTPEDDPLLSASITVATAAEIEDLFRAWESAGVPFAQTLRTEPWQARTFIVRDPDANLILFAGPSS